MQKLTMISMATLLILGIAASFLVLHNPFTTSQHVSSPLQNNLPSTNQVSGGAGAVTTTTTSTTSNAATNSTQPSLLSSSPPTNTHTGDDDGGSDS